MSQMQVPGSRELLDDAERLDELLMSRASVERRLRGLSLEEIFSRFTPEEIFSRFSLEERLRGLTPAELAHLRELLAKSDGH